MSVGPKEVSQGGIKVDTPRGDHVDIFFQKTTLGPRGDASLGPTDTYGFDMWGQYSQHMALLIGWEAK